MLQLAIGQLNADKALLEGSELTFTLTNTEDAPQVGASLAATLGTHGAVALIGGKRSSVSAAVASIAQRRNIMQLSYNAGSDWLSDEDDFPLFGTVRVSVAGCLRLSPSAESNLVPLGDTHLTTALADTHLPMPT